MGGGFKGQEQRWGGTAVDGEQGLATDGLGGKKQEGDKDPGSWSVSAAMGGAAKWRPLERGKSGE